VGSVLLAQAAESVCGPAEEAHWLCLWVLETTESEGLARLALVGVAVLRVVLIVVLAFVATQLIRRGVSRFGTRMEHTIEARLAAAYEQGTISDTQRFRSRRFQRLHAITGVIRGALDAVVWITAILLILSVLGVRLQPILAGAGLASIIIGFGAQQLIRDVLAGIAMLIEDQYGVGDWIEVDGKIGRVERVGLRSTAFRDVDGVVHHVLNGYIERVGNLSQEWARATFDVPLALDSDVPAAKAVIERVATGLASDPLWGQDVIGPPEIWGVQSFGPTGLTIRVVIPTISLRNWDVTRQLRERLHRAFDEEGLRMPSQLVDLGGQRMGYPMVMADADRLEGPLEPHPVIPAADLAARGGEHGAHTVAGDDGRGPDEQGRDHGGGHGGGATEPSPAERDATVVLTPVADAAPPSAAAPGPDELPHDATQQLRLRGPEPRPD
jgi:moderate conductance mechanosensitive channel